MMSVNEEFTKTSSNPKRRLDFSSTNDTVDQQQNTSASCVRPKRRSLFEAIYCGFALLDGHYTRSMLPWIVAETAQLRSGQDKVILRLTSCGLQVICQEQQKDLIEHKFSNIVRFFRCKPDSIAYLVRTSNIAPLSCHVFKANGDTKVSDLISALQQSAKEAITNWQETDDSFQNVSAFADPLPSDVFSYYSHFEVLYIGRVEINDRKPSSSLIDEAVRKFNLYKTTCLRSESVLKETEQESPSMVDVFSEHKSLDQSEACSPLSDNVFSSTTTACSSRVMLFLVGTTDIRLISLGSKETLLAKRLNEVCRIIKGANCRDHFGFLCVTSTYDHYVCYVIKCRDETIVDTVMQAMKGAFSAALTPEKTESPNALMLKHCCPFCPMEQYAKLCSDLEGLSAPQIHETVLQRVGNLNPEQQEKILTEFKRLCQTRRNLADIPEETHNSAGQQISNVGFHRRNIVLMSLLRSLCESTQKYHEIHADMEESPLVNLLGVRRRSLSGADVTHKLIELGGRAKRSLSISLDTFGRKLSTGEESINSVLKNSSLTSSITSDSITESNRMNSTSVSPNVSPVPGKPRYHFDAPPDGNWGLRPRAQTFGGDQRERRHSSCENESTRARPNKSQKLFTKLADGGLQTPLGTFRNSLEFTSPVRRSGIRAVISTPGRRMSWRLSIFSRAVISPLTKNGSRSSLASVTSGIGLPSSSPYDDARSRRSSDSSQTQQASGNGSQSSLVDDRKLYYRSLWKKAIMQKILENRLQAQKRMKEEEREAFKRLKLDYEEITPCSDEEVRPIWNSMLRHPNRNVKRFDKVEIEDAVKAGIPPDLRSDVWRFLMEQHELDRAKRAQLGKAPPYDFGELLKDLTPHQHAVLIDLGRTFPSHPYFAEQLGSGQLCLFNILKAYSLYDTEVGYCQGLSFIAGALLLHMEEEVAFGMFVDLMYRLGLRKQYRPDMMALQIQMYQLSRLVHDRHKDLHQHLEDHEIPSLYAAPWFLTLFASTFPLGFVARVFDFIFLSGSLDVVFKIALVLLGEHKELIKHCDSFEAINDFLKTTLPGMSIIQMERVFNQVFDLEISRDLLSYEVEYHVLQEEMLSSPQPNFLPQNAANGVASDSQTNTDERLLKLEEDNRNLKRQNMDLLEKLQMTHEQVKQYEKGRHEMESQLQSAHNTINSYKCNVSALEFRINTLELERKSLLVSVNENRNGRLMSVETSQSDGLLHVQNGMMTSSPNDSGLSNTPGSHPRDKKQL